LLTLEARLERGEEVALQKPNHALPSRSLSPEEELFASIPGLGDDDCPGFPADACPSELPDLADHCSLAANVLQEDPAVYASLRELRTTSGTSLARCIKPAMDNKGHPLVQTIGAVAGDAECYEFFDALFAAIIRKCQPSWQPTSVGGGSGFGALEPGDVKPAALDPSGARVTSVQVCARRNLFKFHMPPAMSREERREVERLIVDAFASLGGELKGTYLPLAGSKSHPSRPEGMSPEEEDELESDGILFEEPDADVVLSSGAGKHWPDARGVYVSHNRSFAAWVNEEDHVKLISRLPSSDLGAAFHLLCSAEVSLVDSLKERAHTFAWTDRLGFLTSCPSHLGTGLSAEVHVRLPVLGQQSGFQALCQRFSVCATCPRADVWSISNEERLGSSASAQVNRVAEAVHEFLALEVRLTEGEDIDLLAMPEATDAVSEKKPMGVNAQTTKATASATVQDVRATDAVSEKRPTGVNEQTTKAAASATVQDARATDAVSEKKPTGVNKQTTKAAASATAQDVRKVHDALWKASDSGRLLAVLQSMAEEEDNTHADDAAQLEARGGVNG